jgi:hypothetical protein
VRAQPQPPARGRDRDVSGPDRYDRRAEHVEIGLDRREQVEPVALAQRGRRDEHVRAPFAAQRNRLPRPAGLEHLVALGAQRAPHPPPRRGRPFGH